MAYPMSSTVSNLTRIMFLSNHNDWLIADGVFRHSMYNLFNKILKKQRSGELFVSKCSRNQMVGWMRYG